MPKYIHICSNFTLNLLDSMFAWSPDTHNFAELVEAMGSDFTDKCVAHRSPDTHCCNSSNLETLFSKDTKGGTQALHRKGPPTVDGVPLRGRSRSRGQRFLRSPAAERTRH